MRGRGIYTGWLVGFGSGCLFGGCLACPENASAYALGVYTGMVC